MKGKNINQNASEVSHSLTVHEITLYKNVEKIAKNIHLDSLDLFRDSNDPNYEKTETGILFIQKIF